MIPDASRENTKVEGKMPILRCFPGNPEKNSLRKHRNTDTVVYNETGVQTLKPFKPFELRHRRRRERQVALVYCNLFTLCFLLLKKLNCAFLDFDLREVDDNRADLR